MKIIFSFFSLLMGLTLTAQKTLYDFGAIGKSTINESAIIQNAINQSAGKTLIIPDDTFYVKDLIGISNIHIEKKGNGMLKYFKSPIITHGSILRFNACHDFSINGVIFDGQFPEPYGTALQIVYSKNVTVQNCTFQNNFGEGIVLANVDSATIDNNKQLKTDVGVLLSGGCNRITISRNYAKGGTSDGVFVFGRTGLIDSNINIINCETYDKTGGNGFGMRYAKLVQVTNCFASNCHTGIGSDDETGVSKQIKILSCRTYKTDKGIAGSFDKGSIINGNKIDSSTFGIWIGSIGLKQSTYNPIVTQNTISNTQTGIMATGCIRGVINKNTVMDNRAKSLTYSGVYIMYGSNNVVTNNSILSGLFSIVLRSSDNNFVVENKGALTDQGTGNTNLNNISN